MKKIKTLFELNSDTHIVDSTVILDSLWVINGEGIATEKFNGSSCLIKDGVLYRRYDRRITNALARAFKQGIYTPKREDFTPEPEGFLECDDSALKKGHIFGWVPVLRHVVADKYHREAFDNLEDKIDGTYELMGPKVQCNDKKLTRHELWRHGSVVLHDVPRNYEELKTYLIGSDMEGIVWHHPDGRMVKLRKKDFEDK